MKVKLTFLALLTSLVFILSNPGCGDDEKDTTSTDDTTVENIVLGSIFHDDVSESARLRLAAIEMAVDEINAGGGIYGRNIKLVNLRPSVGDSADSDKAAENAKKLYNEKNAVGVISLYSGLGKAIIGVTNTSGYENLVQCNCSGTSPTLNDPNAEGSDKNDTFYRTVVHDAFQGKLMARVIEEKGWEKVGIYYLDDAYGNGLKDVLKSELPYDPVFEKSFPEGDFSVGENSDNMDGAIAAKLDVLVVISLKSQGPAIINYFTASENGYDGNLLLGDGTKTEDMFEIASEIPAWLGAGHEMMGTEVDNFAGKNSDAFSAEFKSKEGQEPNTFSPTAYDCAYAIAFALLYAGEKDEYTAKDVKDNLPKFKEANRTSDEVEVGIGAGEFSKAADEIKNDKNVDYEGASGKLIWDAEGDRLEQGMKTFTPNATRDGFDTLNHYDSSLNKIQ